jgi:hypothetical protein
MAAEEVKPTMQEVKPASSEAKPAAAAQEKPAAAEAKPKEEKQTNCLACNKPLKKIKRYYRDSKFYCSKKCWKTFIEKSKEEKKE